MVERTSLENWQSFTGLGGSNPSFSANKKKDMRVLLDKLEPGTIFKMGTGTYKRGITQWVWEKVKGRQAYVKTMREDPATIPDDAIVVECHPLLGEKLQTNVQVWIPIDEVINF